MHPSHVAIVHIFVLELKRRVEQSVVRVSDVTEEPKKLNLVLSHDDTMVSYDRKYISVLQAKGRDRFGERAWDLI